MWAACTERAELLLTTSAVKRSIGEVVQSRRRPLLGPSSAFTFKTLLRHYAKRALTPQLGTQSHVYFPWGQCPAHLA